MSNPSAEVKCRHCGEVITRATGGAWLDGSRAVRALCIKSPVSYHEPPSARCCLRRIASGWMRRFQILEDWMRMMGQANSSCLGSVSRAIKAVLANAGGAE